MSASAIGAPYDAVALAGIAGKTAELTEAITENTCHVECIEGLIAGVEVQQHILFGSGAGSGRGSELGAGFGQCGQLVVFTGPGSDRTRAVATKE